MRYFMLLFAGVFLLSGCSLFQRSSETNPSLPSPDTALAVPESEGEALSPQIEGEVAKLNTKVEALETKLDVLTMAFEKLQAKRSQPKITADSSWDTSAQPNLAAPINELPADTVDAHQPVKQVSAAPVPPSRGNSAVEANFRKAMIEFQQGHYRNAAQQFAAIAQMEPNHLLSAHALYWSGEAHARIQQWSSAIESWQTIEKNYPTSTYVPETLAGLAKAYEVQGNITKARTYRDTLSRAFPHSPTTLAAATSPPPEAGAGKSTDDASADEPPQEDDGE